MCCYFQRHITDLVERYKFSFFFFFSRRIFKMVDFFNTMTKIFCTFKYSATQNLYGVYLISNEAYNNVEKFSKLSIFHLCFPRFTVSSVSAIIKTCIRPAYLIMLRKKKLKNDEFQYLFFKIICYPFDHNYW